MRQRHGGPGIQEDRVTHPRQRRWRAPAARLGCSCAAATFTVGHKLRSCLAAADRKAGRPGLVGRPIRSGGCLSGLGSSLHDQFEADAVLRHRQMMS